jgi:hypothetical protein
MRLYVNGMQVASRALTGSAVTSTQALFIGGNALWGEYFKGLIDDVRVYNRALSSTELMAQAAMPALPTVVSLPAPKKAVAAVAEIYPAKVGAAAPARPGKVRVVRRGKRVTLKWKGSSAAAYRVTLRGGWTRTLSKPRLKLKLPRTCRGKLRLTITAVSAAGMPSPPRAVGIACRRR